MSRTDGAHSGNCPSCMRYIALAHTGSLPSGSRASYSSRESPGAKLSATGGALTRSHRLSSAQARAARCSITSSPGVPEKSENSRHQASHAARNVDWSCEPRRGGAEGSCSPNSSRQQVRQLSSHSLLSMILRREVHTWEQRKSCMMRKGEAVSVRGKGELQSRREHTGACTQWLHPRGETCEPGRCACDRKCSATSIRLIAHRSNFVLRCVLTLGAARKDKRWRLTATLGEWEHVGNKPYGNEPEFGTPIYY